MIFRSTHTHTHTHTPTHPYTHLCTRVFKQKCTSCITKPFLHGTPTRRSKQNGGHLGQKRSKQEGWHLGPKRSKQNGGLLGPKPLPCSLYQKPTHTRFAVSTHNRSNYNVHAFSHPTLHCKNYSTHHTRRSQDDGRFFWLPKPCRLSENPVYEENKTHSSHFVAHIVIHRHRSTHTRTHTHTTHTHACMHARSRMCALMM